MRLIDANKLKQAVLDWQDCYNGFSDTYDKAMIIGEIDEQPTIEAEPIKHGHWLKGKDIYPGIVTDSEYSYCSECHCTKAHGDYVNDRYCWNCGTRMVDE